MYKKTSYRLGYPLIIVIVGMPAVLWALGIPFPDDLSFSFLASRFGHLLGILGISLFAVAFILNTRLRFLEGLFGGLDKAYVAHHIVGSLAFIALLFHPLFMALPYLQVSWLATAQFLFPFFNNIPVLLGEVALALMTFSLVLTFYFFTNIAYQRWKFFHQLLGIAFMIGGLHAFLVSPDFVTNQPLRIYIFALVILGITAYAYRTLLGAWLIKKIPAVVRKVTPIHEIVTEVTLESKHPIRFMPGQFMFVSFADPAIGREWHPFSISSNPKNGTVNISAKILGDFTKRLPRLSVGSPALIEGPYGRFSYLYYDPKVPQIWVAGGIGITPFLSMARSLYAGSPYKVDLYYSVKLPEEAVYAEELQKCADAVPNFRLFLHITDTDGFLTMQHIAESSPELTSSEIFLCGPPGMMAGLKAQAKDLGIPRSRIHFERFALQADN